MKQPDEPTSARVPVRLLVRVGTVALVVLIASLLISGSHEKRLVSEVIDEIHGIALDEPRGGLIGRWWVSAAGVDPDTGRLHSFKLECGPIHIAARSARVIVNPNTDSFQFEMWDVVMARVHDGGEPEEDDTLRVLSRFVLGPLPYTTDIIPDKGGNPLPPMTLIEE
ncbi:MAG: hypothetical protein ACYSU7_02175 [Planctomycetota bacterium]|jgi:hypothetical protein